MRGHGVSSASDSALSLLVGDTFQSLRNADYRLYVFGATVTNIGTWIQRVAQDWLVLQLTDNSGAAIGITTGLQFLPMLVCAPMAGVLADRHPKRAILIGAQLAQAATGILFGALTVAGLTQVAHVYVMALFLGIATALEFPARQAIVSELVGEIDVANAVALNSASYNAARIIGPGLAGVLVALLGTGWVIMLNTLSYATMIAVFVRLQTKRLDESGVGTLDQRRMREALQFLRRRPDLLLVLWVVFFVGCFGLQFQITSALMATRIYGTGVGEYGVLGSAMAVGSVAGALHAGRRRLHTPRMVVAGALVFGVIEVLAGLMPTYLAFGLLAPMLGFAAMAMLTSANTTLQLAVPGEIRGRALALYAMVLMGSAPIGSPTIGWIGDRFGPRWSLFVGGIASILGTAIATVVLSRGFSVSVRNDA